MLVDLRPRSRAIGEKHVVLCREVTNEVRPDESASPDDEYLFHPTVSYAGPLFEPRSSVDQGR